MSNYTGPVILVPFIGPRDKFVQVFHVKVDDPAATKKIVDRFIEDGYKPDMKRTRRMYMVNGSLTDRESISYIGPIGYSSRSAHLKV